MEVAAALQALGFETSWSQPADRHTDSHIDAQLDLTSAGESRRFAVVSKKRAPYPNEIGVLNRPYESAVRFGDPLFIAPVISEAVGSLLNERGWSWADATGNLSIQAGTWRIAQRKPERPRSISRTFPGGSGATAIVRALLTFGDGEVEHLGATGLANQSGVTQPRASQVLRQLVDLGLVRRNDTGWAPDRAALLDAFIANYPGPKGSELALFTLDPLREFTAQLMTAHGSRCAVSADVAPDALVGWRRPEVVIIYLERPLDLTTLDATPAKGRQDGNVLVRVADDRSVLTAVHPTFTTIGGAEVELAPISQQLWDLHDLGGSDRLEVAGRLRSWLLNR